jgi:SRSO17 transposase
VARRAKDEKHTVEDLLEDCHAVPGDLMASLERLKEFSQPYIRLLPDIRQHRLGEAFLRGLLSDLDRKSTEPIAENAGMYRRGLQRFIGDSQWDHGPLLRELNAQVERELGDPDGIIVIDPSSFPKKGTHSVGVARQWCGHLGKVDNCQAGVFLGYKTNKGHALIDEGLYVPREWTRDKARRLECGVPKELRFRTAQQLALEMLRERRGLPHSWIAADDEFGRSGPFRRKLRRMGERYVLDVPGGTNVRDLSAPAPRRKHKRGRAPKVQFVSASAWKDALPDKAWTRVHIRDGTKGPMVVWAAWTRVQTKTRGKNSPEAEWLVVTRTDSKTPEIRYHLSNAAEDVSLEQLVHVANARYWVEDCFQRAKGEIGLDHYEVRSWVGWHHHMTLCLVASLFLVLEQRRLSESTPAMTVQQSAEALGEILRDPAVDLRLLADKITRRLQRSEQSRIQHWKKFRRLPPTWTQARAMHIPSAAQ